MFWKLVNKILFSEILRGKITSSHNLNGPFNYSSFQIKIVFWLKKPSQRFSLSLNSAPRFFIWIILRLKLDIDKRIKFKFGRMSPTKKLVSNNFLHNQPLLMPCYDPENFRSKAFLSMILKDDVASHIY